MLKKLLQEELKKNPLASTIDAVYTIILKAIFDGALQPGEKISQLQLAKDLDISRSPIREAMMRLKEDGFLEKGEGGSFNVYKINLKDYVDFYEYRINLESFAAYQASHKINEDELKALSNNLKAYAKAMGTKDRAEMIKLDSAFHEIIAQASQNKYIINAFMKIKQRAEFFRTITLCNTSSVVASNTHKALYDALAKHDEKAAALAMKRDFNFYLKNIYNKV